MDQNEYYLKVSDDLEDLEWDAFVAQTPGGHHTQTSLWAQIKASLGWFSKRIIATKQKYIVGGAQILIRRAPLLGLVGYLVKGPLLSINDESLENLIMNQINLVSRENHIRFLVIQPPNNRQDMSMRMANWGFRQSLVPYAPAPYATLLIDLTQEIDRILAQMTKSKRRNIRLIECRKKLVLREGTQQDLHSFCRLDKATGERNGFSPYSEAYYEKVWEILEPRGYLKLFLAEYDGEPLSALLVIPFREGLELYRIGWSGAHGALYPNEAVYWAAIRWGKANGYHYCDLGGIRFDLAKAIQQDGAIPKNHERALASFKFGFGGQATFYPRPFDRFYNPVLQWGYTTLYPKIKDRSQVEYLISRFVRS
jgi:lipid II:glycine glycyltransferase (peptidoglycan interpeptide bridge formation enzyme)